MPLYARRDVLHVAVPLEQGGCGNAHTRPFNGGEPAKVWPLNCPLCSRALKDDPLWAGTISEIPETPDETNEREDREKRHVQETQSDINDAIKILASAAASDTAFKARLMDLMERMGPSQPNLTAEAIAAHVQQNLMSVDDARAELAKDEHRVRQADPGTCPQCGGPLRKPGSRGPTPKLCADCRGK